MTIIGAPHFGQSQRSLESLLPDMPCSVCGAELKQDANLNGGGANFICGHHAGNQRSFVFALVDKKGREAVAEVAEAESARIERINNGQETPYRSSYR